MRVNTGTQLLPRTSAGRAVLLCYPYQDELDWTWPKGLWKVGLLSIVALFTAFVIRHHPERNYPRQVSPQPNTKVNKDSLALTIESNQQRYHMGQNIMLSVRLENTSNRNLLIWPALEPRLDLRLSVYADDGAQVVFPWSDIFIDWDVQKSGSRKAFVRLPPHYYWGRKLSSTDTGIKLPKAGVYHINAVYSCRDFSKRIGFQHWHGQVKARPISVIVEP